MTKPSQKDRKKDDLFFFFSRQVAFPFTDIWTDTPLEHPSIHSISILTGVKADD